MGLRAWSGACVGVVCAGSLVWLIATSGVAGAASPRLITGKLSRPDYTVIAMAADGRASVARAGGGSFALRPKTGSVTLHLRGPDGVYAGPVVIRGLGRRAIVGVREGARLGSITVHPGHARLGRRLARRWIDTRYVARARHSVPIGAGKFGRARSKPPRSRVPGDLDRDGVPNPLDIDDDGDLTLDNLDRTPRGRVRARAAQSADREFGFEFNLHADIEKTVNANAAAITPEQVDEFLVSQSEMILAPVYGDSAELDCAGSNQKPPRPVGLRYCSAGGTGIVQGRSFPGPPAQPGQPCPAGSFDCDGDGFGSMKGLYLLPRATTAEIRTGDVLIQHAAYGVGQDKCPSPRPACVSYAATLQYVPATSPALVSYSDGQGNSATVSYPVPDPGGAACRPPRPGPPCGGPGTRANAFPVKAGPSGEIVVTLTFWRPQRARIATDPQPDPGAGDSDKWTDIGGLAFGVQLESGGQDCATSSTDPNVEIRPGRGQFDRAASRPANPKNTLTYSVNLTECLAIPTDAGPGPQPFPASLGTEIAAGDLSGAATYQKFFFRRQ